MIDFIKFMHLLVGVPAALLVLVCVAAVPARHVCPDQWGIPLTAGVAGLLGTLLIAPLFEPLLPSFYDFLGAALFLVVVGGSIAVIAALLLVAAYPTLRQVLFEEDIVEIDELPRDVHRAVRPFVRGRWITETQLRERIEETRTLMGQMVAATRSQSEFLREDGVRQRLEAQELLFNRMPEDERGLFAAQLCANAEAKARAATRLEIVERERDQLRQEVAALSGQVEALRLRASATPAPETRGVVETSASIRQRCTRRAS